MYPVLLDVSQMPILVVGGGKIATRKLAGLISAGAQPVVIAPVVTDKISQWAENKQLTLWRREFHKGDTEQFQLIFIATNQMAVNDLIYEEIPPEKLLNDTTKKERSNLSNLALLKDPAGTVGITTFGTDPTKAKALKNKLKEFLAKQLP